MFYRRIEEDSEYSGRYSGILHAHRHLAKFANYMMDTLRRAIRAEESGERLDVAALEIASIEAPQLDAASCIAILDRIASELGARIGNAAGGQEFVRAANDYLFQELGFRGNENDYNDPRNSCLNFVLDRRIGIPITLSVIYIEVARRLQRPLVGIGLPGHFIVEYNDGAFATYMDPFRGGHFLTTEECLQIARERTGAEPDATVLAPVGTRYILVRILNNLRSAYFRSRQFEKLVAVADLLIEAFPRNPEYYKTRGFAHVRLRQFRSAQRDLDLYLTYAPDAEDRAQIAEQLSSIHRWMGRLN